MYKASIEYDTSDEHYYDSSYVTIDEAEKHALLVDQTGDVGDLIFRAKFDEVAEASWTKNMENLSPSDENSVTISDGALLLAPVDAAGAFQEYLISASGDWSVGEFRTRFIPGYDGAPTVDNRIIAISNSVTGAIIELKHRSGAYDKFALRIREDIGGGDSEQVYNNVVGDELGLSADEEILISLTWDFAVNDEIKIFVDRKLFTTVSVSASMPSDFTDFSFKAFDTNSPFSLWDFFISAGTIYQTSDGDELPAMPSYRYSSQKEKIISSCLVIDNPLDFGATINDSLGGTVTFRFVVEGSEYYWNNGAGKWSKVDEDNLSDTSSLSDCKENIGSLPTGDWAHVRLVTFIKASDPLYRFTPKISEAFLYYEFRREAAIPPETIIVGTVIDSLGNGVNGATIRFTPTSPFFHKGKRILKGGETTTGVNGNFDVSVVETESVDKTYRVTIVFTDIDGKQRTDTFDDVIVSNEVVVKLSTLAENAGA